MNRNQWNWKHEYRISMKQQKNWLLEKINKLDKLLARFTKREMTQINNIWNETRDITTNTTDIKDITKVHYKQLYTYELDNWHEMDQSFEKYKLL